MIFCPRFPIPLCKKLGKITAQYRWFALVYVGGMFFLLPGLFVGLTLIDSQGIAMYTFTGIFAVIITVIICINYIQSNVKLVRFLPKILHDWQFLPEALRSLDPYDR